MDDEKKNNIRREYLQAAPSLAEFPEHLDSVVNRAVSLAGQDIQMLKAALEFEGLVLRNKLMTLELRTKK